MVEVASCQLTFNKFSEMMLFSSIIHYVMAVFVKNSMSVLTHWNELSRVSFWIETGQLWV